MAYIDFNSIMKDKDDYLTPEEIDQILQYAYENNRIRDYMIVLTFYRTARRVTEVVGKKPYTKYVGLRPIDIKGRNLIEWDILKKQHIKKRTKKGKQVPEEKLEQLHMDKRPKRILKAADSEYIELLKEYIMNQRITMKERVFPITRRRVQYIIAELAEKAGVARKDRQIHPHMFRHSFAINFLKANPRNPYALIILQKILDHSSIHVTTGYTQFVQTDIIKSLNKMHLEEQ